MKKLALLFVAATGMVVLQSCEGPEGPPGLDGGIVMPQVFEIENVNFDTSPGTQLATVDFENPTEVYRGDVLLVYRYEGDLNGEDLWKPLPLRYYFTFNNISGEVELEYTFDFRQTDASIALGSQVDLQNFDNEFTKNQVFRLVYLPATDPQIITFSTAANKHNTPMSYEALSEKYNLDRIEVKKINVK